MDECCEWISFSLLVFHCFMMSKCIFIKVSIFIKNFLSALVVIDKSYFILYTSTHRLLCLGLKSSCTLCTLYMVFATRVQTNLPLKCLLMQNVFKQVWIFIGSVVRHSASDFLVWLNLCSVLFGFQHSLYFQHVFNARYFSAWSSCVHETHHGRASAFAAAALIRLEPFTFAKFSIH